MNQQDAVREPMRVKMNWTQAYVLFFLMEKPNGVSHLIHEWLERNCVTLFWNIRRAGQDTRWNRVKLQIFGKLEFRLRKFLKN
jgi:hypothetical protein